MIYKGRELTEFKSNKNIAFNPPRQMLVWDNGMNNPLVEYVGAFCPSRVNAVIANDGIYRHCAEIQKGKTNWDVYQERYGATMKSLDEALELFNAYVVVPCQFCPARGHCASDVRSESCRETFKEWAETEAKDETAGNV